MGLSCYDFRSESPSSLDFIFFENSIFPHPLDKKTAMAKRQCQWTFYISRQFLDIVVIQTNTDLKVELTWGQRYVTVIPNKLQSVCWSHIILGPHPLWFWWHGPKVGPWNLCLGKSSEHIQEQLRQKTRLTILPKCSVKAAGRQGRRSSLGKGYCQFRTCRDMADSDKEVEVILTIWGSGKGNSTVKWNKESRKGWWAI